MVEVTPDGSLYAFVLGQGLVASKEDPVDFQTINDTWGDQFVLHLAADLTRPERLFVATAKGELLASTDRGMTWTPYGG
jgi:hypothetical protein